MTQLRDPGKVVIIGGGPTGLGAAWRLQELGYDDYLIVEGSGGPGGLAGSVVDAAGFTWDMGGHVQFSHYTYYDDVLDAAVADGWLWHERESWVWMQQRFVPYPFQYNIHRLNPERRDHILKGLRQAHTYAHSAPRPRHFCEWIKQTFGEELAELFMYPYNFKVWGYPLEQMAWHWIGERVAVPDIARIERNIAENKDDVSWGPNNKFRFPRCGGTGAIWQGVARLINPTHLRFGCQVTGINTLDKTLRTASGERLPYDTLVSSMPLDVLVAMSDPLPPGVKNAARAMRHSAVHILGIGLCGGKPASLINKCWMYFPEDHSPYYRVTVFSHYSPNNIPEGNGIWSLMAEVCESPHKPVDTCGLQAWTLKALRTDKLIEDDAQVLTFWHRRLEHGYPTPFLGRDQALGTIMPALEARRIYSRGRFGGWKYEVSNQDHSFMQGVELMSFLIKQEPETTYPDPARANSGAFLQKDNE